MNRVGIFGTIAVSAWLSWPAAAMPLQFDFGTGPARSGYTRVAEAAAYNAPRGFGFENPAAVTIAEDGCSAPEPFAFSVTLPEGNYRVSVTVGSKTTESTTTIKAEARRLMSEKLHTQPGEFTTRTFTVNIRTPQIASGGAVRVNNREAGARDWDEKLTLEFCGTRPAVRAVEISRDENAVTVYLAGDSTVTDQVHEPYAGWGQMLPRFFLPGVPVANHAESGRALFSFRAEHRLDKILSTMKPGDYLFIQFGHNDQKDKSPGAGPFTTYKANLKQFIAQTRQHGGLPVLVTPMERRRWSRAGMPELTLTDYAEAVRQVAREETVPVIDLHAMSRRLYAALGPEKSTQLFVHYPANTFPGQTQPLKDDTHHNAYGGYELAKCMVEGIKASVPALAKCLQPDLPAFDPDKPDSWDSVIIPASPLTPTQKPAGN